MKQFLKLLITALLVTAVSQFGNVANNGRGCNIGSVALVVFGIQIFIVICEYRKNRVTPLFVVLK